MSCSGQVTAIETMSSQQVWIPVLVCIGMGLSTERHVLGSDLGDSKFFTVERFAANVFRKMGSHCLSCVPTGD